MGNPINSCPRIKKHLIDDDETVKRFFRFVFRKSVMTSDSFQTDRIIDDPTDNKFLACALETKADYIVSGDNHLLELKHYQGIQIVDARTFIKQVTRK